MQIEQIAQVIHETNRALCEVMGDSTQVPWAEAPDGQKQSTRECIRLILDNPATPPFKLHDKWIADMRANGWTWGPTKDLAKKTHPCCCPYDQVPEGEKAKDRLFKALALALAPNLGLPAAERTMQARQCENAPEAFTLLWSFVQIGEAGGDIDRQVAKARRLFERVLGCENDIGVGADGRQESSQRLVG